MATVRLQVYILHWRTDDNLWILSWLHYGEEDIAELSPGEGGLTTIAEFFSDWGHPHQGQGAAH